MYIVQSYMFEQTKHYTLDNVRGKRQNNDNMQTTIIIIIIHEVMILSCLSTLHYLTKPSLADVYESDFNLKKMTENFEMFSNINLYGF